MNLSKTISPIWSAITIGGFVSVIALVTYEQSRFEHEGVISSNSQSSSGVGNSKFVENQIPLSAASPSLKNAWDVTGYPAIDNSCGEIKNNSMIGDLKRAVYSLTHKHLGQDRPKNILLGIWSNGYENFRNLQVKYGDSIKACVPPNFFTEGDLSIQKSAVFNQAATELATINNQSLQGKDRYEAWLRLEKLMDSDQTFVSAEEILSYMGSNQDDFLQLSVTIGVKWRGEIFEEIDTRLKSSNPMTQEELTKYRAEIQTGEQIEVDLGMKEKIMPELRRRLEAFPVPDYLQTMTPS